MPRQLVTFTPGLDFCGKHLILIDLPASPGKCVSSDYKKSTQHMEFFTVYTKLAEIAVLSSKDLSTAKK